MLVSYFLRILQLFFMTVCIHLSNYDFQQSIRQLNKHFFIGRWRWKGRESRLLSASFIFAAFSWNILLKVYSLFKTFLLFVIGKSSFSPFNTFSKELTIKIRLNSRLYVYLPHKKSIVGPSCSRSSVPKQSTRPNGLSERNLALLYYVLTPDQMQF